MQSPIQSPRKDRPKSPVGKIGAAAGLADLIGRRPDGTSSSKQHVRSKTPQGLAGMIGAGCRTLSYLIDVVTILFVVVKRNKARDRVGVTDSRECRHHRLAPKSSLLKVMASIFYSGTPPKVVVYACFRHDESETIRRRIRPEEGKAQ